MELSDRKKKILRAIVDLYIRTAEPVAVWQLWMNCQGKNMALPLR